MDLNNNIEVSNAEVKSNVDVLVSPPGVRRRPCKLSCQLNLKFEKFFGSKSHSVPLVFQTQAKKSVDFFTFILQLYERQIRIS